MLEEAINLQAQGIDVKGNPVKDRQKVKLGEEGDATSLENMKAAFAYIRESNELRSIHDDRALLVTDYAMAVEQIQVDASKYLETHSRLYGVGENLMFD